MLSYFFGITALGAVRPYFRKHVYGTLEPIDFMFINSLLIAICVTVYFTYLYNYENHVLVKTYDNCCKLTATQIGALLFLAGFTVVGSIWFFHLEKYFNTPFVNNILLKSFSILALFVMVSIWGLIGLLGSMLGVGQGGSSPIPVIPVPAN
jgi:hypothetical protein